MTSTAIAVVVVLATAAALVWVARVIVDARRDTESLRRPVSRQAIERLRDTNASVTRKPTPPRRPNSKGNPS